ncbi:MAG: DNRLRE domain-containing protein [Thaumarchaeota archaeon]|nr:DNRLRE domain-containing protein [Nitrososphaerota archaeon]
MGHTKNRRHAVAALSILLVLLFTFGNGIQFVRAASSVTDIAPTDDAYVAADSQDPQDKEGFQHVNTGHIPFLKAWYAWDVTKTDEHRIITIVYLKFNLTKISGPIESASLVLHPFVVNLTAPMRPVDVYTGLNNNWNESSIVFAGAPAFSPSDNSTAFLSNSDVNKSVSWDLTRQVRSHQGSLLTLSLVIRNSYLHNEELVDFYSKEAADPSMRPDLVVVQPRSETTQAGVDSWTGNAVGSEYAYLAIIIIAAVAVLVVLKRKKREKITPVNSKAATDAESNL